MRLRRMHPARSFWKYRSISQCLSLMLALTAFGCELGPAEKATQQSTVRAENTPSKPVVAGEQSSDPPDSIPIRDTSFSVKELWRIEGLGAPAGLVFDHKSQELRMALIGGEGDVKDGDGVISRVSTDGEILEADWSRGLNAPKDLALDGDTLWVTDIDTVIELDRATGTPRHKHEAPDARFLVGITIDAERGLLLADLLSSRILSLKDGVFEVLHESLELQSPARLWKIETGVLVAPWGYTADFSGDQLGNVFSWNPLTKAIELHKMPMNGHWMGLCPDGDGGWFLADFESGAILQVRKTGVYEKVISLGHGLGTILYVPDDRLLIATHITENRVVAWRLSINVAVR